MSKIIQSAANGQRKAMKYLYENNKQKAFYIAHCLLLDKIRTEMTE